MNDMRQKLLPVFLEEAGRKIAQLDAFLAAVGGEGNSLAELETAFRAAHTLKGTAALVQAEAVRSLSGRIEGLLEGHFEQDRLPSEIEYEAMQLALDRLKQLIAAVEKKQCEPAGLLVEAERALTLATAMPGNGRLADLLSAQASGDPFADDPLIDDPDIYDLTDAASPPTEAVVAADPFADDPEIEQVSIDSLKPAPVETPDKIDPFADDPGLEMASSEEAASSTVPASVQFTDITDPFAEDPSLEYVQEEISVASSHHEPIVSSDADAPPSKDQAFAVEVAEEVAPAPWQEDSFIDRMRRRIEKESPLQTAERLSKTLLSQDEADIDTRHYSCCHFRVGAKDYYLPIANMIEIADIPPIIHLPLAPTVVRGLVNLRGQVLPVIDLGIQTGVAVQYVAIRKLVIAEADGEKLAFLADGIPDLLENVLGEKVDFMNFVDQFRAGAS
jgi:chemotaxis protein histidine kinase CheA